MKNSPRITRRTRNYFFTFLNIPVIRVLRGEILSIFFLAASAFILLACVSALAFALSIPPQPDQYVNDFAGVLQPDERSHLNEQLRDFEKQTTDQLVVAIFPSLEDEELEDFSNRLFQAWKIGQKNRDNGVLLIAFIKEHRVRIEVGYGLEGVLTDALSARIIRNELAPQFREGKYAAGIQKAIDAIEKATRGEYKAPEEQTPVASYAPILIFVGFLILMMLIARRNRNRSGLWGRRGPFDDWWMIPGGRWGGGGGGFSGGGFGGGFGGGGGFSGGGGSSGGGGASGGW